jgi:hypothetical protein
MLWFCAAGVLSKIVAGGSPMSSTDHTANSLLTLPLVQDAAVVVPSLFGDALPNVSFATHADECAFIERLSGGDGSRRFLLEIVFSSHSSSGSKFRALMKVSCREDAGRDVVENRTVLAVAAAMLYHCDLVSVAQAYAGTGTLVSVRVCNCARAV